MSRRCPYCGHGHDLWALDLFSGAGGSGMGIHQAGVGVIGVDSQPQPNYPFTFIQADALQFLGSADLSAFSLLTGSPPCQRWAGTYQDHSHHPDLLTPTRAAFKASGKPYMIENIPTAPMPDGILLCGATFGLPTIRHRRFEVHPDPGLVQSLCPQRSHGRGVTHGPGFYPYGRKNWGPAWRKHVVPVIWPWMTLEEAGQAIPPAYTEYLVRLLLDVLEAAA